MIFAKGPTTKRKFLYNVIAIENTKEFFYLGVFLSRSVKFNNAKKLLTEQTSEALLSVRHD